MNNNCKGFRFKPVQNYAVIKLRSRQTLSGKERILSLIDFLKDSTSNLEEEPEP